jgi:EAL domain-containing protein (putative c-di-GMP-specific phosphodiesterase class I)
MQNDHDVSELLSSIRANGVEIAIDDFGTGFSSLSYLQKFKVELIKIDKSFIQSLQGNRTNMALTEAILIVAGKLGIRTVAEGVETQEQRDLLLRAGCNFAQCYFYAKPMQKGNFERFLRSLR